MVQTNKENDKVQINKNLWKLGSGEADTDILWECPIWS